MIQEVLLLFIKLPPEIIESSELTNPSTITFSNTFPKNKEDIILGIDMNINSNINCIIICILDVPIDKNIPIS